MQIIYSIIVCEARRVTYDSVANLLALLFDVLERFPGLFHDHNFVLWKADASNAFRLIPVHPVWQLMQVVSVEGRFHVDRCLVFGGGI